MPSEIPEFPFPLVAVEGEIAEAELSRLIHAGKREGFAPVILGSAEEVRVVAGTISNAGDSPEEILRRSEAISVKEWFNARQAELEAEGLDDDDEAEAPGDAEPPTRLHTPFSYTGRPHKQVYIARIPVSHSWEIPAYLRFGGWNECPDPEVQVAVSRYWHDQYGAELACLGGDVTEYLVSRPPHDQDAANLVAHQQYLFCQDIVSQGVGTVGNLSKTLLGSAYWFFWWD